MGNLHKAEFASGEFCTREIGLRAHLDSQFYPSLPEEVKTAIQGVFAEHWKGDLDDLEEMAQRSFLRSVDAFIGYFDAFLDDGVWN